MKKLHNSEFNSNDWVIVTIDSEYRNNKVPYICSSKVLHNYFGETIPGGSGVGKIFHECSFYGNGSEKTSVEIPEMWVTFDLQNIHFSFPA